ncbi:hypothetical protein GQR58_024934 [Nymphon striatum]|nr:hypothetical protein GQR58_024934 [Nymphon striatum]
MEGKGIHILPGESAQLVDSDQCIICQSSTSQSVTSTVNGRNRIREAANIRNDITLGKLDISTTSNEGTKDGLAAAPVRSLRSSSTPRPRSSPQCDIYKTQCAVCGFAKHHGIYDKYRISETNRAQKFLEATVFLQDDIYTRSCDLQDVNGVFGADLYCHKYCINRYIQLYGRRKSKNDKETPISSKLQAWSKVIKDIDIGLNKGEGYELSHIRDSINKHLDPDGSVRNKKVKVLLVNHFGDKIGFFQSKQVTKSAMCFSKSVSTEHLVNTIRATDPIRESAELIMQSLKEVDFDLEDRFCNANAFIDRQCANSIHS